MTSPIMAIDAWKSNAELMVACRSLGYLDDDHSTWDCTYGYGTFWKLWRPRLLIGTDLDPAKTDAAVGPVDFTASLWPDRHFDHVVFDAPYKLNGRPSDTDGADERYGVHHYTDWRDRMDLIRRGITECDRAYNGVGYLLLKCQDQVCSGKVRWQTIEFANHAATLGLGLVDRFDLLSYRPQPAGRRQVHARRNSSTLLVFKRGWGL